MSLSQQQISEQERNRRLRNLAFKICETLYDDRDVYEGVKLMHGMTLPKNLGFVRLYRFVEKGNFGLPKREGFTISCYRNFLNFGLVNNANPLYEGRKWGSTSFFHVVKSTIAFLTKRHKKIIVEVNGKKRLKLTIYRDLSFEINEFP
jgi:hypothetical protein